MRSIRETTFEHSGHANRSVHAKSHGVLHGTLTVAANLPPALAQGLFAKAGNYKTVMRLSTLPGDILNDSVSTPRGLAFKVIGIEGGRLPGSGGDVIQDFVMVNAPAFSAPTAQKFLGSLKTLAGTLAGREEPLRHRRAHFGATQNAWSVEGKAAVDDGLSFGPWHGLAAHRPLGGVNRARNGTYTSSAKFRGSHNGCPMHEPRGAE